MNHYSQGQRLTARLFGENRPGGSVAWCSEVHTTKSLRGPEQAKQSESASQKYSFYSTSCTDNSPQHITIQVDRPSAPFMCSVNNNSHRAKKPTSMVRYFNKTPFWEINSAENSYVNIPHGHGSIAWKKTLCSINNCHQAKNSNRSIFHYHQAPTPTTKSPIDKSSTKPKHAPVKETHLKNTT